MRIEIWSDVVCPWCYLGSRRLDRALARLAWRDEVEVRWRAYQLDPRAPIEPQDLEAALDRKYGPGAYVSMTRRLTALGAQEGLDYRFELAQRVNTLDAHRLLAWAATIGPAGQGALAERLFRSYFTEGGNVADPDLLGRLAADAGLDPAAAAVVLGDGSYRDEVRADIDAALDHGISGVPAFVLAGRWLIPGAQDVETMVQVLERARTRLVDAG
ncbi:MAG: DsbA family oxidoreductase [Acidimicrobiales bacterium]|nr:DsbA family oxidoreductase [Acidimicrobiales bacterium]